jgi:hypothetical protein
MVSKNQLYIVVLVTMATFFLMLTGVSDAKIDPQTVAAMWLFDEGSGAVAKDASGNGNDGKINGCTWVDGNFGKALNFNGNDNFVLVSDSPSLSMTNNMTLVAWINPSNLTGISPALIRKGSQGGADITWFWYLRSGAQLDMFSAAGEAATTFNPAVGTWYHLATTLNESNVVTNYINGALMVTDFTFGSGTPTWSDDDNPLNIGEWITHDFAGIMDEVAIFNVTLPETEIKNIVATGLQSSTISSVFPSGKLATTWASLKVR